jgi:hypothetical protein
MPANTQLLLGLPGSTTAERASFATKSLWVTPYDEDEMYPGGKYPLQNVKTGGVARWVKKVSRARLRWHDTVAPIFSKVAALFLSTVTVVQQSEYAEHMCVLHAQDLHHSQALLDQLAYVTGAPYLQRE